MLSGKFGINTGFRESISHTMQVRVLLLYVFQSTPFARRETPLPRTKYRRLVRFNPLPSQEGRPIDTGGIIRYKMFQSTPFARRETNADNHCWVPRNVSIHSLRKKGDSVGISKTECPLCFNPLPSQEGRHYEPSD